MPIKDAPTTYDVCIVGWGAGGGMAAYVLTHAGAHSYAIRWGGRVSPHPRLRCRVLRGCRARRFVDPTLHATGRRSRMRLRLRLRRLRLRSRLRMWQRMRVPRRRELRPSESYPFASVSRSDGPG